MRVNTVVQLVDKEGKLIAKEPFVKYVGVIKNVEFHYIPTGEPGDQEPDEILYLILEVDDTHE